MKALFLTDTHIRGSSPSSRKDNFPETILNKMAWVVNYANENNIECMLHGGDWLNRPDISLLYLNKLVKILKKYNGTIYTVLGNHDIYGYNPRTFDKTPLSLLESVGIINRLSKKPILFGDFELTGTDATHLIDKKGRISDYTDIDTLDKKKLKIHVVHGFLTNIDWPNVNHTRIDSIYRSMTSDIILSGHEHGGYGIIKRKDKLFCNPGALARVSAGICDVNQIVKVAIIDSKTRDIELIYLPNDIALPSDKVLDREKLEEEKKSDTIIYNFSKSISEYTTDRELDLKITLDNLILKEDIEDDVIDLIRGLIEKIESR